jgi:hypothetical protein
MSRGNNGNSLLDRIAQIREMMIKSIVGGPGIAVARRGDQISIEMISDSKVAGKFPARITGSSLISGHDARWSYNWTRLVFTANEGASSDMSETGAAINLIELAHIAEPPIGTPWYVWGIDCHNADVNATLSPRPVGGGGTSGTHKVDVVVEITRRYTASGDVFYTFETQGSVEAVCDT